MRVFLEVSYRKGKPFAAYLYLPRQDGDVSFRAREVGPGIVADYAADGRVIGLEFVTPAKVTPEMVNSALRILGLPELAREELAPLAA